jgi:hypothetical protein
VARGGEALIEGKVWAVAYGTVGVPMREPKIMRQIEELSAQGWGSRRIANELGVARNTIRRYLRGGEVAQQQTRPHWVTLTVLSWNG